MEVITIKIFVPSFRFQAFTPGNIVPGLTGLSVGVGEGIGIELFITFVLVLCVYSPGTTPLAIGLSIATCHLFAVRCRI